MTKSTITRERLAKIKSWRETYGAGSNVMLPAEEAEELACLALAAMDSEPVAWTDEEELRDVNVAGIGYLFGIDREANKFADPRRQIMLYRHAQPAPDGYVMVPMRLTAENGAKGALSGEFSETKFVNCPECFGDDECETCDGSGRIEITVPVTWTTIKAIWVKGVEHFAATAQENN
ncbi:MULTISPECIES: hypothetical protein [Klebsiella]|uniref:hypothetical protein n=1 Tax=Klebsiella TaxID=570 RepID=UPI000410AA1F|nr:MULTISPECIES: hypothetical protein [Klebsiella]EGT0046148.1 hypothetical protein [Klebsiella oxytoca]ELR0728879.1 hypothetical protein [Klebsiella oxytoca]MBD7559615.1 hypothetical protein [Klebsiella pneumoniae]MBK0477805.1 hypothetical protein [Klebsiella pneumoniae]MBK0539271.1 hypothetical protein [Klebsiella pneumoniae]